MTQTFKHSRKVISGVGFSNPLTHDFQLENSSHVKVWADDTLLTLGVDYTLDEVGNPAGYEVNIVIPDPGSEPEWWGNDLFILSVEAPVGQADDISLGGSFGVQFEDALDKLSRRVLQIYDMALRAIKSPRSFDPTTLDQDDLEIDPAVIPDLIVASDAAIVAADAAEASAAAAAASEAAADDDADQTALDRAVVAADKATVAADKAIVAADKATVLGYRDEVEDDRSTIEGYRDEVEADRVEIAGHASTASTAAGAAVDAQTMAEAAAAAAAASLADFVDHYLGAFDDFPATDIDLSPLEAGDLFYATGNGSAAKGMYVWDAVAEDWFAAFVDGTGVLLKAQNLADLPDKVTARTNLSVYSIAAVDAMPGSLAEKTTPVNADSWGIWDSVANAAKRVTGTNLKAFLKTYFDTLYEAIGAVATHAALTAAHGATGAVVGTTNAQTLSGKTLTNPTIDGTILEDVFTITDAVGFSIDPDNGSVQRITLGANRTPAAAPASWTNGKSVTLFIADGSAFTITWTTLGVVWKGGTAPTLATSGWTEINITKENGVLRGVHVGDYAS